jgi:hypothetical protein
MVSPLRLKRMIEDYLGKKLGSKYQESVMPKLNLGDFLQELVTEGI